MIARASPRGGQLRVRRAHTILSTLTVTEYTTSSSLSAYAAMPEVGLSCHSPAIAWRSAQCSRAKHEEHLGQSERTFQIRNHLVRVSNRKISHRSVYCNLGHSERTFQTRNRLVHASNWKISPSYMYCNTVLYLWHFNSPTM